MNQSCNSVIRSAPIFTFRFSIGVPIVITNAERQKKKDGHEAKEDILFKPSKYTTVATHLRVYEFQPFPAKNQAGPEGQLMKGLSFQEMTKTPKKGLNNKYLKVLVKVLCLFQANKVLER